jgi:hypothetical protein
MIGPNLFIVGAPKCGTTALATYLGSHPDVFVADTELSYFGNDLDFRTESGAPWHIQWDDYLEWFAGHEHARYRCDRSVFYLYSQCAAREIHHYHPASRIIVMLRDPVDQMYSEHSEMVFQGEEDLTDFASGLAAEEDRSHGRRIPRGCRHPFALLYRSLARYGDQLERYLDVFSPEQIHVVVHDDFVSDRVGTYRRVLEFLDVDPSHRPEMAVVNGNKVVRSPALRTALRRGSPGLRRAGRLFVPSASARAGLRRRLHAMNVVERPRPALDQALRQALRAEFEPEVRRLESVLGRRLLTWRQVEVP